MAPETADPIVQIVDCNKQDVGRGGVGLGSDGNKRAQGEDEWGKKVLHGVKKDVIRLNPGWRLGVAENLAGFTPQ
jgi:hypothetical protein